MLVWSRVRFVRIAGDQQQATMFDRQSKGVVEHLVGYAKTDLVIAAGDEWTSLGVANDAARGWCVEVNAKVHSEIAAIPAERLAQENKVCPHSFVTKVDVGPRSWRCAEFQARGHRALLPCRW